MNKDIKLDFLSNKIIKKPKVSKPAKIDNPHKIAIKRWRNGRLHLMLKDLSELSKDQMAEWITNVYPLPIAEEELSSINSNKAKINVLNNIMSFHTRLFEVHK